MQFTTALNTAAIWGGIGSARFFSGSYKILLIGFPLGIILPFVPWGLNRLFPAKIWHKINVPVLFAGPYAGATASFILPAAILGFVTQFYLFRRQRDWFEKYNYVLSIALDCGAAFCTLAVTLVIYLTNYTPVSAASPATAPDEYCYNT